MKTQILIFATFLGTIFSELISDLLENKYQFIAILAVVFLDLVLGVSKAIKNGSFKTSKAFKSVFMLSAFWFLLATILFVEKAYPFASFLSEAILLPIILFQLISIIKNMHLLGLINGNLADKLLQNIDKHKELQSD